jgi:hypothetical protein
MYLRFSAHLEGGEVRERLHKKTELFRFVNAKNWEKKNRPRPRYRGRRSKKRALH